ncbi:Arginase/deacetylase [Sistotremastrum suecicum HHB10207 ss-3]|uniref:Arginase/deacetylase n=1 Tax=Sistotremastrum suecicum HHB10207 ss-3 TaxID=1314776 RepID=A0A166C100_9AGAM|nr:Arginase/deacetylase [Sistotremastrum suecicum HHB10207 ss-3]
MISLLPSFVLLSILSITAHAHSHDHTSQTTLTSPPEQEEWTSKYGPQIDIGFSGPLSFSHLPQTRCLDSPSTLFDIAILGMPFDTSVSYRPGARFGPFGIRSGSRRMGSSHGWTTFWGMNPYEQGLEVIDCGDVPVSPYDNALAIDQMEAAYTTLISRPTLLSSNSSSSEGVEVISKSARFAKDGKDHPRIVTLGGDHTIVLPILRALHKVYGPVSVIHYDSHMDTGSATLRTPKGIITHGSYFLHAKEEGLLIANTSIHAGIRGKLSGPDALRHDESVGFELLPTEIIDDIGVDGIVERLRARVGDRPVYLSVDIDVIDPGLAPATGTPEAGGWTTREVKRTLRGLKGLNIVGADLVEVAPAYDHADITSIVAADLVHDFLALMTQ